MSEKQICVKELKEIVRDLSGDISVCFKNGDYKEIVTGLDDDGKYITFRGYKETENTDEQMTVGVLKERIEKFGDDVKICYYRDMFPFCGYLVDVSDMCVEDREFIIKK